MNLIKARPQVRLYLPPAARPGERVVARIVLDAQRPVSVGRVTCTLEGTESISIGSGNQHRSKRRRVLALQAVVLGSGQIAAGQTELRCAFDLPPELPASYEGKHAQVRYVVTVDVDIPWWLDRTERFQLVVAPLPYAIDDPGPSLHATAPEGPRAREPQLELSLDSQLLRGGETLHGRLALLNTAFNPYETATIALAGFETVFGRRVEVRRYRIRIGVEGLGEGVALPFGMKLPSHLAPTTTSALYKLDWAIHLKVDYGWRRTLEALVPVTVLPEGATRRRAEHRAPHAIGSGRLRAAWEAVAQAAGLVFDPEAQVMRGKLEDVAVVIRREHRGSAGIFLVAELGYPSLGLDLDGGEASSLRRILGGGVSIGHADWDKRHYLTGRDPHQVRSLVEPLAPVLLPLNLGDVDDGSMLLTRRDPGQSSQKLARFVDEALRVAQALPRAREAIVAPERMASAEASWSALARRLGGALDRARMAVAGRLDDLAVAVSTAWDPSGEPLHTEIEVAPPRPPEERHELSWVDGRLELGELTALSERARSLFATVTDGARAFTVSRDMLSLWLPAPILDAESLIPRIEALAAFGAALHGDHGPYR